jgi:nucleotide-binding universal stress UspA family protein
MELYKKILVAVDGSEASLHALNEAVRLSYWVRGSVRVISVVPPYEGDLRFAGVKNIEALLREPCENILAKIKEAAEEIGAAVEAICREGEPFEEIIGFAEREECDLLVTGIEEKHNLYRALIRGVTERLAGYGKKDLLVIPYDTQIDWNKILISTDGSQAGRIAAIRAIEIAKAYGGELLILSVSGKRSAVMIKKSEEYIREIESLSSGIANNSFMKTGNAARAITDLAAEQKADMIVMGTPGEKSMMKYFSKSTIEKVIYSSPCPVLVVKNQMLPVKNIAGL